jgi:hypothetical protein
MNCYIEVGIFDTKSRVEGGIALRRVAGLLSSVNLRLLRYARNDG